MNSQTISSVENGHDPLSLARITEQWVLLQARGVLRFDPILTRSRWVSDRAGARFEIIFNGARKDRPAVPTQTACFLDDRENWLAQCKTLAVRLNDYPIHPMALL